MISRKPSRLVLYLVAALALIALPTVIASSRVPEQPETQTTVSRCGKCGDGTCVRQCGETPETCPVDCGISSPK